MFVRVCVYIFKTNFDNKIPFIYIYIYIYMCVCVCENTKGQFSIRKPIKITKLLHNDFKLFNTFER